MAKPKTLHTFASAEREQVGWAVANWGGSKGTYLYTLHKQIWIIIFGILNNTHYIRTYMHIEHITNKNV